MHRGRIEEGRFRGGLSQRIADVNGKDGVMQIRMRRVLQDGVYLAKIRKGVLEILQELGINIVGGVFVPPQHLLQGIGHVTVADTFAHGLQRISQRVSFLR